MKYSSESSPKPFTPQLHQLPQLRNGRVFTMPQPGEVGLTIGGFWRGSRGWVCLPSSAECREWDGLPIVLVTRPRM